MSQPTGLERARHQSSKRRASLGLGLAGALLVTAQCTFPQYEIDPPVVGKAGNAVVAGAAGDGAMAGRGGASASPSAGAGAGGVAEGGRASEAGAAGAPAAAGEGGGASGCPAEQWPVGRCEGDCLTRYPDHCYDQEQGGDELAPDCGGSCQPCVLEACVEPDDCLSGICATGSNGGVCQSPLVLLHEAYELNNSVSSTAWSMTLRNVDEGGGRTYLLRNLRLRYYFDRNGVTEPILLSATQANLYLAGGQSLELKGTSWSIVRVEDARDAAYNAYVEVSFDDSGRLFPGDEIELYEQMLTGDPSTSNFEQRANYSFTDQPAGPWQHVTVIYREELAWGLEPRPSNPRACFAKGVNLNGPALSVDGNAWLSASQAGVMGNGTGISQGGKLSPAVSGETAAMLATGYRLQAGDAFSVSAENGQYLLYLYAVSPTTHVMTSQLTVDGKSFVNSSKFRSQESTAGLSWARLGPYRLSVTTGKITVAVTSGSIDFAGFELWYPE
jgi:hypothetical protein